eukprot:scaffold237323_cov26-Prasinocladus_malaysianus.AAC.1
MQNLSWHGSLSAALGLYRCCTCDFQARKPLELTDIIKQADTDEDNLLSQNELLTIALRLTAAEVPGPSYCLIDAMAYITFGLMN